MHRLFSWTADAVGCWARLVVGVCSPFQKIDHDKSMVDYSAKCAPAFAPAHTIPIDIHHRHALTCDLRIPNPAWFRDSTDLFFHFFLSQPGRKACFYPPPPGLFFYGAPTLISSRIYPSVHCSKIVIYKAQCLSDLVSCLKSDIQVGQVVRLIRHDIAHGR